MARGSSEFGSLWDGGISQGWGNIHGKDSGAKFKGETLGQYLLGTQYPGPVWLRQWSRKQHWTTEAVRPLSFTQQAKQARNLDSSFPGQDFCLNKNTFMFETRSESCTRNCCKHRVTHPAECHNDEMRITEPIKLCTSETLQSKCPTKRFSTGVGGNVEPSWVLSSTCLFLLHLSRD